MFPEQSGRYKNAIVYTESKNKGRDYDIKNIEFDIKGAHDADGDPPGDKNGYARNQGQRKTPKGKE